ncbi:MAG: hypothetical protein IH872_00350 [Chloroflexi bacterium]|nr:hypothetical protein [Chloroflexota bacterium]
MLYLLKGCGKCGGDLSQDGDEWRCFQCGRVYYPAHSPEELNFDRIDVESSIGNGEATSDRERPIVRRSARHLNPVVGATRYNEELWWNKNQQVIFHLDEGKKVREIAKIVGQGPRQIRVVRERLRDLRSAEPELVAVG